MRGKIPKRKRAKKTTVATKRARKRGARKKAGSTPVGDIMRNAAEMLQSVAKTIRP